MPVNIKLPDGSTLQYNDEVTCARVAEDISERLGKRAVAAEVDGRLRDLTVPLESGTHEVKIVPNSDPRALEILRHTTAHVLAQAVVRVYGAEVQYTIGPPLSDDFQYGFYYDFDLPAPISQEDLPKIEAEMKKIVTEKLPVRRIELPAEEAKAQLLQLGQHYKGEMIDDLVREENVSTISLYHQGDFVDMCRGPHLSDTGKVKAFKLLTTAGAYWRGDETNKMLTRIYGTAFFDSKALEEHLQRIEEARRRDHRVIGKALGLFHIDEQVGPGLPLWLPKGTIIRMELEDWLRGELLKRGYQPVVTPHIGKVNLYKTSGHYPYYEHGLFPTMAMGTDEGYLLKPMNCPHHMLIYKVSQHSYRELPIRLSEFGTVYRFEQSGELSGLIRVRGFTQDDAHIFCTPEQLEGEIGSCIELTKLVLQTLGLGDYRVRIGLRDADGEKYIGKSENWDLAESNIRHVVQKVDLPYTEEPGEAAFYGPKIDFIVKDCIGREWQLGTIQVDYNLPERFALEYMGADNRPHRCGFPRCRWRSSPSARKPSTMPARSPTRSARAGSGRNSTRVRKRSAQRFDGPRWRRFHTWPWSGPARKPRVPWEYGTEPRGTGERRPWRISSPPCARKSSPKVNAPLREKSLLEIKRYSAGTGVRGGPVRTGLGQ
jgi:threonyl-tRNA synthetase